MSDDTTTGKKPARRRREPLPWELGGTAAMAELMLREKAARERRGFPPLVEPDDQ